MKMMIMILLKMNYLICKNVKTEMTNNQVEIDSK